MGDLFPFPTDQKAFSTLMINIVGLYGVWEVLCVCVCVCVIPTSDGRPHSLIGYDGSV